MGIDLQWHSIGASEPLDFFKILKCGSQQKTSDVAVSQLCQTWPHTFCSGNDENVFVPTSPIKNSPKKRKKKDIAVSKFQIHC